MRNNPEFNSFQEAREKDLSLREIKESIRKLSIEQRQQLSHEINKQIISELHNWMQVKRWDELNFLRALTLEWNTISWTDQKEADSIVPWDIIKIEWDNILKNWNSIWKVQWFKIENNQNLESTNNEETQTQNTQVTEEQNQSQANQEENTTELNDDFVSKLAAKSGKKKDDVQTLINYIKLIRSKREFFEGNLITLNKHIEKFYS